MVMNFAERVTNRSQFYWIGIRIKSIKVCTLKSKDNNEQQHGKLGKKIIFKMLLMLSLEQFVCADRSFSPLRTRTRAENGEFRDWTSVTQT